MCVCVCRLRGQKGMQPGSLEDDDPCVGEAIRQQLECLMAERTRLSEDNHRWVKGGCVCV